MRSHRVSRGAAAVALLALLVLPSLTLVAAAGAASGSFNPNRVVSLPPGGNGNGHGGGGGGGGGGGHKSFTCPTISGADTSVCSTNWSGYADSGSGVTFASGSWVQPSVTCPSSGSAYAAFWVGIDGYSSSTVEQTGTLAQCSNGVAYYSAWYEFYPNPMFTFTGITVKPGDHITASVTYSNGEFTVKLTDGSTSSSASASVSGASRSSAEWVVERPALCNAFHCTLATLADFGSSTFTGASATVGGATGPISQFSSVAITMVGGSSGPILAEPSSLSGSSTSTFSVAYG